MDSSDSACLVCHEAVEVFAIGKCDHPICFKCSTRLRALCDQFDCPICRTDLPEVFFMYKKEKFDEMPIRKFILNRKLRVHFENDSIRERFEKLLEHRCPVCKDRAPERSFKALRDHMRRVHTLFYCDLCAELKIFPSERKLYNRQELATHRRIGDKDDTSYKGHPLCQFCDERYLDKDELYKHLRKDHYYCHFCESLGSQDFFHDYDSLREHFRNEHYMCEEGECATAQFENAFRSDIDLKSHRATHHSRAQSKHQARQERALNIDINLAPRPNIRSRGVRREEDEDRRAPRHQGGRGGRGYQNRPVNRREKDDIDRAVQASLSTMKDDENKRKKPAPKAESSSEEEFMATEDNFPTLGGDTVTRPSTTTSTTVPSVSEARSASLADRFALSNSMSVQHGISNMSDFPSLRQGRTSDNRENLQCKAALHPKSSSIKPHQTSNGLHPSHAVATRNKRVDEDFPELPVTKKPSVASGGTWVQSNKPVTKNPARPKSAQQSQSMSSVRKVVYNDSDFPSLGGSSSASGNMKWFKSNKDNPVSDNTKASEQVCNGGTDSYYNIADRFSPVNIPPDLPKTNSKKKKKKDKTQVEKVKKESSNGLKGNSSLDDIASLLLSSNELTPSDQNSSAKAETKEVKVDKQKLTPSNQRSSAKAETREVKVDKQKDIKSKKSNTEKQKEKKKVDKVEQKLESMSIDSSMDQEVKPAVRFTVAEEFPSLGSAAKKPPPGFIPDAEPVAKKTPPGFTKPAGNKPPPGFGKQEMLSTVITEPSGDSSAREILMPNHQTNFDFAQPNDFNDRNRVLIARIQSICFGDPFKFTEFKSISGEFRRSEINAGVYYKRCEEILGTSAFIEVFPELIALLPDIEKQQEFLTVHGINESIKNNNKGPKGGRMNGKGAWSASQNGFLSCSTCRQVLLRKDYNTHMTLHDSDSDFPALAANSVPVQKLQSGSWVKA